MFFFKPSDKHVSKKHYHTNVSWGLSNHKRWISWDI